MSLGSVELDRRSLLRVGVVGATAATVGVLAGGEVRGRVAQATPGQLSDIQHDIVPFLGASERKDGTLFHPAPAFTFFVTARLRHRPTKADAALLADALAAVEDAYPAGPEGVFPIVAYGRPYLARLPRPLVAAHLPRLVGSARPAFDEAVASPNDVLPDGTGPAKRLYDLPVTIEANDVLLTLRSDRLPALVDALGWLAGGDHLGGRRSARAGLTSLWQVTSKRLMFLADGMPRRVADDAKLAYARRINPESPMWMGFADNQANGAGPAAITTFAGNVSARLTDAKAGDYFDNGSVQHLSHTLLDLDQYYLGAGNSVDGVDRESYNIRVQYMFRSNPAPSAQTGDGRTDGGGRAYLPNDFRGRGDAEDAAQGNGVSDGARRIGHLAAMQRASRAPDGTPLHVRADGPGFDDIDVPGGGRVPKLHFSAFVPSAHTFAEMRRAGAAADLASRYHVAAKDNGLERFMTTTRRQNFVVPPRRHRAFPLVELL